MASNHAKTTVVVTGLTGFITTAIAIRFLEAGYTVRGTVRTLEKGEAWKKIAPQNQYGDRVELAVVPDMLAKSSYHDAVKGANIFVHVASPLTTGTDDGDDYEAKLTRPAIDGTLNALEAAAAEPSVHRFVLTSSILAAKKATDLGDTSSTVTPTDWATVTYAEAISRTNPVFVAYGSSKYLAEKAAWDFLSSHSPPFTLATILPAFVFGRAHTPLDPTTPFTGTNAILYHHLFPPGANADTFWGNLYADVRDVAEAHFQAAVRDEAKGKRFLVGTRAFADEWLAAFARGFPERKGGPGLAEGWVEPGAVKIDVGLAREVLGLKLRSLEDTAGYSGAYFEEVEKVLE